jgi:hypothetical protein
MSVLHEAERVERVVSQLSPDDLAAFRAWFTEFDRANRNDSSTKLSEFFRPSPLAEAAASGELHLTRDRSFPVDRRD